MMEKQTPKNDGPVCACGKVDLYDEWLKLQLNRKEGIPDTSESIEINVPDNSDDDTGKMDNSRKVNESN